VKRVEASLTLCAPPSKLLHSAHLQLQLNSKLNYFKQFKRGKLLNYPSACGKCAVDHQKEISQGPQKRAEQESSQVLPKCWDSARPAQQDAPETEKLNCKV